MRFFTDTQDRHWPESSIRCARAQFKRDANGRLMETGTWDIAVDDTTVEFDEAQRGSAWLTAALSPYVLPALPRIDIPNTDHSLMTAVVYEDDDGLHVDLMPLVGWRGVGEELNPSDYSQWTYARVRPVSIAVCGYDEDVDIVIRGDFEQWWVIERHGSTQTGTSESAMRDVLQQFSVAKGRAA